MFISVLYKVIDNIRVYSVISIHCGRRKREVGERGGRSILPSSSDLPEGRSLRVACAQKAGLVRKKKRGRRKRRWLFSLFPPLNFKWKKGEGREGLRVREAHHGSLSLFEEYQESIRAGKRFSRKEALERRSFL